MATYSQLRHPEEGHCYASSTCIPWTRPPQASSITPCRDSSQFPPSNLLQCIQDNMVLADPSDRLFRPEDKALKMLFPTVDDEPIHGSFDDFLDDELYNLANQAHNNDDNDSPSFESFLVGNNPGVSYSNKVPMTATSGATPQPWRKGLWCMNPKSNAEILVRKTRRTDRAMRQFVSPTHLVHKDDLAAPDDGPPQSRSMTKPVPYGPKPATPDKGRWGVDGVSRKDTFSPTPMYTDAAFNGDVSQAEKWQQDFQNFHLQMPDNGFYLVPQRPQKSSGHDDPVNHGGNTKSLARYTSVARPPQSPTRYHYPFNHDNKVEPDYSEVDSVNNSNTADTVSTKLLAGVSENRIERARYTMRSNMDPSQDAAAPVWSTGSSHSSDSSSYSQSSARSGSNQQQGYPGAPLGTWMSTPPTLVPNFSTHDETPKMGMPTPHRAFLRQLNHQSSLDSTGLDFEYAGGEQIGRAVSYVPAYTHNVAYSTVTTTEGSATYPPLPPYPSHIFSDVSPFTPPRVTDAHHSRSPTPSISPAQRTSQMVPRQRSPSRLESRHSRRKSLQKPGPIRDCPPQDGHRRARSLSRPPRTPKTPKTPVSAGFPQIDFVNFTPRDSAKLMSDVAPSGSSKTRARREQEAKDKRKRLSEAALQAVRRAGGDVTAFEEAIFV